MKFLIGNVVSKRASINDRNTIEAWKISQKVFVCEMKTVLIISFLECHGLFVNSYLQAAAFSKISAFVDPG